MRIRGASSGRLLRSVSMGAHETTARAGIAGRGEVTTAIGVSPRQRRMPSRWPAPGSVTRLGPGTLLTPGSADPWSPPIPRNDPVRRHRRGRPDRVTGQVSADPRACKPPPPHVYTAKVDGAVEQIGVPNDVPASPRTRSPETGACPLASMVGQSGPGPAAREIPVVDYTGSCIPDVTITGHTTV